MRLKYLSTVVLGIVVSVAYGQSGVIYVSQPNCNAENVNKGPYPFTNYDPSATQHSSGDHQWANTMTGGCSYTGQASTGAYTYCTPHATANSQSSQTESGSTGLYTHQGSVNNLQGVADGAAGTSVTSSADGEAAFNSCLGFSCGAIGIGITSNGSGFNVSYTNVTNKVWSDSRNYPNVCTGYVLNPLPICQPYGPPPYDSGPPGASWAWDISTCSWYIVGGASPIIIDTTGGGFKFTDPSKENGYVTFDLKGDGTYFKVSWPRVDSGNAWLVLDTTGDGIIKSGKDLFGNFTPHADGGIANYPNPNGFNALAWYDQPAQGGDGNLIIDKRDKIWHSLKLWIDQHCYLTPDEPCESLPGELHPLESLGVTSISLVWDAADHQDAFGNSFRYYAALNPESATTQRDAQGHTLDQRLYKMPHDGRYAYDVFLKTKQN